MRNNVDLIIRAIARSLQNDVLPSLTSEAAVAAGRMNLALLHLVLAQETVLPELYAEASSTVEMLLRRAEPLLDATGVARQRLGVPVLSGLRTAQAEFERRQRLLSATCEALVKVAQDGPEGEQATMIEDWLADAAASELDLICRYREALTPARSSLPAAAGGPPDAGDIQLYITGHLMDQGPLTVTDVHGAGFSMSKQIQFVTVRDESGRDHDWVLRQEKPINFMGGDCTRIVAEYPLMQCAYALGLPAPEPLWLEKGPALGPSFMLMRKLPGRQLGEPFAPFEPLTEDMIMQMGGMLATLHGQGLDPFEPFFCETDQMAVLDMDLREATIHRIEQWEACFRTAAHQPIPSKDWLFSWLKKNVPAAGQRPVLVHGDFNIHNMLQVDGAVTALLDWEWGHSGNPAEDLINIRPHVEKYSDWDRFIQHYQAHGGPQVEFSERIEDYNRCLTNMIYAVSASRMSWHVGAGDLHDLASVFGSNIYGFEFQNIALTAALNAARADIAARQTGARSVL